MILYKSLGHNGRLGNCMMQISSVAGLARKFNKKWQIPEWGYAEHFETTFPIGTTPFFDRSVRENVEMTCDDEFWKQNLDNKETLNIEGYLQSPTYWDNDVEFVRSLFKFKPNRKLDKIFKKFKGKNTALHVRKGDYIGNINYYSLGMDYYIEAMNILSDTNIILFTDDYECCRKMFTEHNVDVSLEGLSDIDHLYLMTKCDNFICSNSTFSWWGAYLGEKKGSIVIRPDKYFTGRLSHLSTEDLWPKHWMNLNILKDTEDYSDVTFVIPVCYDSKDRIRNLELVLYYISVFFDAKVIVGSWGSADMFDKYKSKKVKVVKLQSPYWHRTQFINKMIKMSDTSIVVSIDADVLVPTKQMSSAVNYIYKGFSDFVYPYDGKFVNMSNDWCHILQNDINHINFITGTENNLKTLNENSGGGCIVVNKAKYIEAGMENENFVGHAPEDVERYRRLKKLGYNVSRTDGSLYHIDHFRGTNSTHRNTHKAKNTSEVRKVTNMSKEELRAYVNTWSWCK